MNAKFGRGGMAELIEEGEAVFAIGGRVKADGGVGRAEGEMVTARRKWEVIIGGDFLVLWGAVLVGGDLLDDQEGVGRVGEAGREEFDPERLVFVGFEGMVDRSF